MRYKRVWRRIGPLLMMWAVLLTVVACGRERRHGGSAAEESLRQVLHVQSLYNHNPGEDIVPQIAAVVDSMRRAGRNPYYFAAVNILIDRLFSDGRFAEADSLAVIMEEEALEDRDSVSMAMAKRVRAQMFYKLSQPSKAYAELYPAGSYIANPYRSGSDFGTASSIQEWLWIIARERGDTAGMNRAGLNYAKLVDEYGHIHNWTDTTGHYRATSLAFRAQDAFSNGYMDRARVLLDSAAPLVVPSLPPRAYEHLYEVRCRVRIAEGDWTGALADADTLLMTHRDFPWFYLKDLLLKAEVLSKAGRHEESTRAYADYIAFHDSLSAQITDRRLQDLTLLYRTEIDHEQKRTQRFRMFAFGSVILLLVILLIITLLHAVREKRRVRLLVERLQEFDRAADTAVRPEGSDFPQVLSPIERLDNYMASERPYTDPSLTRKELAEYLGITQDALGKLIKTERAMSVRAYINSFRLEEARRILGSDSREGIAEIAGKLGLGTARTLQRAFKERYDMSPTQYRDAARELGEVERPASEN